MATTMLLLPQFAQGFARALKTEAIIAGFIGWRNGEVSGEVRMRALPRKNFLSYLGGKSLLASKIIPKIPEHTCYCEVFAGAAWLLFKKEESEVEIINDINTELVTLYRVLKYHLEEFIRHFKWCLTARDEFERLKKESPEIWID